MTLAIVKPESYRMSEDEQSRCLQHLARGYDPNATYRALWAHSPPISFGEFLEQYADVIVAVTAPTADRWRVALSEELAQRKRELDQTARELRAALATLAESTLEEGPARDAQQERQCAVVSHYGKAFQITAALAIVTRELRALRKSQLEDAAAIVSMIASNAGVGRAAR